MQDNTPGAGRYQSVFRPKLFVGHVHWVTGAGSGIGRCVAHELASLGATVILSGRTQDKLDSVAAEIIQDGGRCDTAAFDIRDEDAVKAEVTKVVAKHGAVHGLVNNAGGQFPSPLAMIGKRGFDAVVANNLTGGFLMMRELFKQSMQEHGGAIVNMTADFRNGMPGMGHSGAARAGMANLTQTAAFEWAHAGVRVNAVAPGWVASSGMDSYPEMMRPMIRNLKNFVPLRRLTGGVLVMCASLQHFGRHRAMEAVEGHRALMVHRREGAVAQRRTAVDRHGDAGDESRAG